MLRLLLVFYAKMTINVALQQQSSLLLSFTYEEN